MVRQTLIGSGLKKFALGAVPLVPLVCSGNATAASKPVSVYTPTTILAHAWPADVPRLQAAQCPSGEAPILPAQAVKLPISGGVSYIFDMNGRQVEDRVPPDNFVPLTATADVLAELIWPARPDDPKDLALWEAEQRQYKGTDTPKWCTLSTGDRQIHGPSVRSKSSSEAKAVSPFGTYLGHSVSTNFVGYVNIGSFQKATGHYTQPSVSGSGDFFTWFGLNGSGTYGELLQAGSHNNASAANTPHAF